VIIFAAEFLAVLLAVTVIAVVWARDLFAVIVLLSVYSGLLATIFAVMGAVDVAFMEAVVGTSLSTVFLLGLMWWIDPKELTRYSEQRRLFALVPAVALGGVLLFGINALPVFGDPNAPAMHHVSPVYATQSVADMATPNAVAAVLADYRSFDTLIEAAVVVAAVLSCLMILKHRDDPIV
jgi:multicomponent Na+:H+ antiporter subunit B